LELSNADFTYIVINMLKKKSDTMEIFTGELTIVSKDWMEILKWRSVAKMKFG
jgi:hypothetical protein